MPDTAVVTGKTGPGYTVTSKTLENVTDVVYDLVHQVCRIKYGIPARWFELDYYGTVTVTQTISGHVTTFTLST